MYLALEVMIETIEDMLYPAAALRSDEAGK
jgi:hypothetical protein